MTSEIQYISGIGPRRAAALEKYNITTKQDLLDFFPRRYLDRSKIVQLNKISEKTEVTVIGKIEAAGLRRGRKPVFYLVISDGKGILEAVWFNYVNQYKNMFSVGEWISLSGKVSFYRGYQMVHPDFDKLGEGDFDKLVNTGKIIPVYPGSESFKKAGLNSYTFRKIYQSLFASDIPEIKEVLTDQIVENYGFINRSDSYKNIHAPQDKQLLAKSIRRFKYEEFFFIQLMLALQKKHFTKDQPGNSLGKKSIHLETLFHQLPFEMTSAQKKVVKEIRADLKRPHPMHRLLQGDVGSGKTLVALMAALIAIDNGFQVALMVPTEVLAEQHYFNISRALDDMDIAVLLLTRDTPPQERKMLMERLTSGESFIVVGTHALIQESVSFPRLGLVIIDEQHRFGVLQRATLLEKGNQADVLVMTATPIPRTLALTVYGNLDVSILDEMPPNRQEAQTFWRSDDKTDEIYKFIKDHVKKGEQVFIVYPLVEESEKIDLKAATESYKNLSENYFKNYSAALLHGKMKSLEKERIMRGFASGNISILFATTVIEVGVDVPNATIMLVEHAERFGLSQLHQLRGRIGRGQKKSFCILKTPYKIGENAEKRLQIMTETSDGFRIAEEDLNLRGYGEFFGTRQHGLPAFKIANPILDQQILIEARRDAFRIIQTDPQLRENANAHLREYFTLKYSDRVNYIKIS
jgi:ATP-dependent DNA helicase RecG